LELRGRKLGRYDLLHRITRGGMSEVLLGQLRGYAGFRKLVILKRVAADSDFGKDTAVQMLIREARLTSGFVHSNIAQVFDLELIESAQFLSMEFVPGVTLRELLTTVQVRRERPPPGFCLTVVREIAEALHYAHTFTDEAGRKRPVIHRDVAPKNVIIRWDGVTKLLDFGLAKSLGAPSQTVGGAVKGTVAYMSPEQFNGQPLDGRTDVFSLGLILYELLMGAPLASGDEMPPALRPSLPPLLPEVKGLPGWVDSLLTRMLSVDPALRIASAREVSREILRLGLSSLWEQDAVAGYLEYLFAAERAQMQKLLAELAPEETTGKTENPFRDAETIPRAAIGALPPDPSTEHGVPRGIDVKTAVIRRGVGHETVPVPGPNATGDTEEGRAETDPGVSLDPEPVTRLDRPLEPEQPTTAKGRSPKAMVPPLLWAGFAAAVTVLGAAVAWYLRHRG
jgi:tRNA A-37 threonylcarbamoyl transferase component Bud32